MKKSYKVLWQIIKVTNFTKFVLSFICYLFLSANILLIVEPGINNFGDSIWYCFVSSTTLGYGDIIVITAVGRVISIFLALYGLLFFGCLSGIMVTYYTEMSNIVYQKDSK